MPEETRRGTKAGEQLWEDHKIKFDTTAWEDPKGMVM